MDISALFIASTGVNITNILDLDNKFNCIICNDTFPSVDYLTLHYVLGHHMVQCFRCTTIFSNKDHLESHRKLIHFTEKCSFCSEEFGSFDQLSVHQVKVHSIHSCIICFEELNSADGLRRHATDQHRILPSISASTLLYTKLQTDIFFCQLCSLRFAFSKFLDHFLVHHRFTICVLLHRLANLSKRNLEPLWVSLNAKLKIESSQCPVCEQCYTATVPIIVHKVFCFGEKYCSNCEKIFSTRSDFLEHRFDCKNKLTVNGGCETKAVPNIAFPPTCSLCTLFDDGQKVDVSSLTEHYLGQHKLSPASLLIKLDSMSKSINQVENNVNDVCNILPAKSTVTIIDFDTRMVKFVYSSFDDTSSDEEINSSNARKLICAYCQHRSASKLALINHMHKIHGLSIQSPEFWCKICKTKYSKYLGFRKHNRKMHRKVYKCPFCPTECKRRSVIRDHVSQHVEASYHPCTSRDLGYNCRYCKHSAWSPNKLNDHVLNMHADTLNQNVLICLCCAALKTSMASLRSHMAQQHPAESWLPHDYFLFQCEICRINFPHLNEIRKHMSKVHPELKTTFCPITNCYQIINNNEELNVHNRVKHKLKDAFQCKICSKIFKTGQHVEYHYNESHKLNKIDQ